MQSNWKATAIITYYWQQKFLNQGIDRAFMLDTSAVGDLWQAGQ